MKHVLLVEDDEAIREVVGDVLTESGFDVETASNGREGLERAHAHVPDVIVTNLVMPELDGERMIAACRADQSISKVPVAVMSAMYKGDQVAAGVGADAYVAKPFDIDDLVHAVQGIA